MFLLALTRRESKVLRYIRRHVAKRGCTPTSRQIADHFGICPCERVGAYLSGLQRKGCIRWTPGRYGTIELTEANLGPRQLAWNLLGEGILDPAVWRQEPSLVLCHQ
jgi:SOS-response transcriptional repressor LexA